MTRLNVFINLILIFIILILFNFSVLISKSEFSLMVLLLTSGYSMIYFYMKFKGISVGFLFLISFNLFNLGRIVIYTIEGKKWYTGKFFTNFYFDEQIVSKVYLLLFVHLIGIIFSAVIIKKKNINYKYKKSDKGLKLSKKILIFSLLPIIIRTFLEIKVLKEIGYVAIYTGEFGNYSFPFYLKGWNMLFTNTYYLFIAFRPEEKDFKRYSLMFLLVNFIQSIKGGRTSLVINLFIIISMYIILYNKKIKLNLKFSFLIAIFLLYLQKLSKVRVNIESNSSIFYLIKEFIADQGISILVIGFNILYNEKLLIDNYKFLLSPIYDSFIYLKDPGVFSSQSEQLIMSTYNLSSHLSYAVNSQLFLKGYGLGGNYIAELYNFGGTLFVFFFGFVLGYILINIKSMVYKSRIGCMLSIIIIKNLYISPRGSLIPSVIDFFILLSLYFLFEIFNYIKKGVLINDKC